MAPIYPEEVDVFTVPHSRMKQLVHTYLELVSYSNFCDVGYMTGVLEKLCHTFHVFKAHEQIENRFIMRRLKDKLTALDITDTAVCNCHSDNRLTEMLSLVLDGYRWAQRGEGDRVKYGLRLRRALEDFTQIFIPHMKEEEEVFQPMLVEYFTYDELKELKVKVIQQHLQKEEEASGKENNVPESQCDSDKEEAEEEEGEDVEASSPLERLPAELTMQILSYLSPRDLCRVAQVSQHLNRAAMDPSLWHTVLPVQWAAGDWTWNFNPSAEQEREEERPGAHGSEEEDYSYLHDEDADKDESSDSDSSESHEDDTLHRAVREVRVVSGVVRHLLGRVGSGVVRVDLAHSRGISSSLLHRVLKLCPNLGVLTLAHTKITDAAFREYGLKGVRCSLEHLDLSGCENITDSTLHSLAGNPQSTEEGSPYNPPTPTTTNSGLSCCGKSRCSGPPSSNITTLVEVTPVLRPDHAVPDGHRVIVDDNASFTDVPLQICDILDLGGIPVPAQTHVRSSTLGTVVSCCSVMRTCCSSETGRAESRDCTTTTTTTATTVEGQSGDGCGGGGGDDGSGQAGGQEEGSPEPEKEEEPHALHQLTHLSLNGCYRITDDGLRALSARGGLPQLKYLDLSGCLTLSGEGVARLVDGCRSLDHQFLFYCDNVYPDPFPDTASGCRNLECNTAFCCRSGD